MNDKALSIYLNDHLAGATAGTELAKRARGENRGSELGGFLEHLAQEIGEDRETLRQIMRVVGASEDPIKKALALVAERLGRLKLNGSLLHYSDLSRIVELDGLSAGVAGKRAMWIALGALADPRLASFDFGALTASAERQLEGIEGHRRELAPRAFG